MNILEYKKIYTNDISGAYLFYGDEKFLMDNALIYIIKKYIKEDFKTFNLTYLDGKTLKVEDIISASETLPVFAEKRLLIIRNINSFIDELEKSFYDFLDGLGDFLILIFLDSDNEVNKSKKFYKYFKKNNRNIEFSKLKGRDVFKFVEGYLTRKGYKINSSNLSYLISKSGYNSKNLDMTLFDLKNEIDKILSLSKTDVIDKNLIDSSMTDNTDTNIFNFLDAISSKNTNRALIEYNNLHSLNEPVNKILYMFIRQVRNLIRYKELSQAGYNKNDIMKEMNIKSYEFGKVASYSKNFISNDFLYKFYKNLLEVDINLKTTSIPENILMEMLIIEFTK